MAVYDMNTDALFDALRHIEKVPNDVFDKILSDPDRMTAIKTQVYSPITSKNTHMSKADTERFFNVTLVSDQENKSRHVISEDRNNDRDLLNRALAFYFMRITATPERNRGELKKAAACFGQPDGLPWILSFFPETEVKPTPKVKTEQEKEAEQDAARAAVDAHISGKSKKVKDQPKPIQKPETITAGRDPEPLLPSIGTAFLANGMQFVLYKPSEAYQMPDRCAIIDNYFYADTISLLYGQAGSFKTWFALWEGVCLALGKELCGLPINDGEHRVLYVSLEMTAKGLANRLQGMTKDLEPADREKVNENFVIISAENTSGMKANDEFLNALAQLCTDQRFDVIYIDSFADFIAGYDIRSENDMTAIIDKLRGFVLMNHVSFRIIHHGTKPTQDTNGSMAGIHTIRDLVDYVFLLKADSQNEIKVTSDMQDDRSAKSRYSEAIRMTLKFVSDDGSYCFKQIQDTETSSFIEKMKNVLSLISDNEGITNGELRKQLGNPKDFSKILSGMIGNTIIEDSGKSSSGQKTKVYYTVEYWNENIKH